MKDAEKKIMQRKADKINAYLEMIGYEDWQASSDTMLKVATQLAIDDSRAELFDDLEYELGRMN